MRAPVYTRAPAVYPGEPAAVYTRRRRCGAAGEAGAVSQRRLSARRRAYEARLPVVAVRLPAAVRQRLRAAMQAEGLSFADWVQARLQGEPGGDERRGERVAATAGFLAGVLAALFAAEQGRSYSA